MAGRGWGVSGRGRDGKGGGGSEREGEGGEGRRRVEEGEGGRGRGEEKKDLVARSILVRLRVISVLQFRMVSHAVQGRLFVRFIHQTRFGRLLPDWFPRKPGIRNI